MKRVLALAKTVGRSRAGGAIGVLGGIALATAVALSQKSKPEPVKPAKVSFMTKEREKSVITLLAEIAGIVMLLITIVVLIAA